MYLKGAKSQSRPRSCADLVREASASAEAGNKTTARYLLKKAASLDPDNEEVWLWRASLALNLEEAVSLMGQVLRINPRNEKALAWMRRARELIQLNGPAWLCPLCEHEFEKPQFRCPHCQAVVDLEDLEAIAKNELASPALVHQAIDHWAQLLRKGPNATARIRIATAHLNLLNSVEAVTHLREACRLDPDNERSAKALEQLLARKFVMVVTEGLSERNLLKEALERQCIRVRTSVNGLQALGLMDQELPDLIFLDVSTPELGGHEVCRVLNRNSHTRDLPVVMILDKRALWQKWQGRRAGAADFLFRPVDPICALEKVWKFLSGSKDR